MEKDKKIRELLGMKQDDMAMLLKVTRSQWSMYEIGKRDLPLAAELKLGEMLAFVQQSDTESADIFPHIKMQQAKIEQVYENLKLINAHRQIIVERKLKLIEKKYEVALIALKFIRFLEIKEEQIHKEHDLLLTVLKLKAEAAVQKNGLHIQAKHQHKLQTLLQEELLLNKTAGNL